MRLPKKVIILGSIVLFLLLVYVLMRRLNPPESGPMSTPNTEIPSVVTSTQMTIPESILILPGSTYAIDGLTGMIVKIEDDNNVQRIYNKKTTTFSASGNRLYVIPQDTTGIIDIVDADAQKLVKTIANPQFGQIIDIDYQADTNKLFVLGSYDPTSRTSSLYEITRPNEDSFQTRKILDSRGTEIETMTNNYLVIFQMRPGLDISALNIVDASQSKILYTFDRMTTFQLSPDKGTVLVRTMEDIQFFSNSASSGGLKPFNTRIPSRQVVWRDNNSVIFAVSSAEGVLFKTYDIKTAEVINEFYRKLPEPIQLFMAVKDNKAIIQLSSGTLYELPL